MRIQTTQSRPDPELCQRVARALAAGGRVALPTETVYGLAARADDPAALAALAELKRRPADAPWTWHVGSASALERFERVSPMVLRLAERYWPGPLSLVLPGAARGLEGLEHDGWTGVRCVAHPLTAALLDALEFPVVMTSVNRHGEPPATDAAAIEAGPLGAGVELVVDAGPSRLSEPSAVLRVGRGRFELLREGLFELDQLRATAGLRIAFACTGNTCRSPMAEGLTRQALAARLETTHEGIGAFGFEVTSFGVFASVGAPASAHAVEAMHERGIDISAHTSRPAAAAGVADFDRVYCLTRSHAEALRMLLPPGKDKNLELLDPEGADVSDPIGGSLAEYRRCAEQIATAIGARVDEWA